MTILFPAGLISTLPEEPLKRFTWFVSGHPFLMGSLGFSLTHMVNRWQVRPIASESLNVKPQPLQDEEHWLPVEMPSLPLPRRRFVNEAQNNVGLNAQNVFH